jgi:hypothetical protein
MSQYHDVIFRKAEGCLAEEFKARIEADIFGQIPRQAYREDIKRAKLELQELYHTYRKRNPCSMTAFGYVHECVYQFYIKAFDRLDVMDELVRPAPRPQRRREALTAEEDLITQIAGLRKRIVGDVDEDTDDTEAIITASETARFTR